MQSNGNVRKDINKLNEEQFSQFHVLLRLLHIFKADQNDGGQYQYGQQKKTTKPKCMYDSLISMHARCCEHKIQFFNYWHRWFTLKFEQYLLKAHHRIYNLTPKQIGEEAQRLVQIVEQQNKFLQYNWRRNHENYRDVPSKEKIIELFTEIQKKYRQVCNKLPKQRREYITAPYWNLWDIKNEINYPKGYRNGEQIKDFQEIVLADELIRQVWNQDGIYEINFYTRYGIEPGIDLNPKISIGEMKKFKQLISDKEFWRNPGIDFEKLKFYEKILLKPDVIQQKRMNIGKYFQKRQYQERGKKFQREDILRFNVFSKDEINFILGGSGYNYYKKNEVKNQTNPDVKIIKKARNLTIGYWNYGQNLKTAGKDFLSKFCTTRNQSRQYSMETVHNMLHNDQGYIMSDAAFSVTNPIFFAYHSFLDLILQFKILETMKENTYFKPKFQDYQIIEEDKCITPAITAKKFFAQKYLDEPKDKDGNIIDESSTYRTTWKLNFQKENNRQATNQDYPIIKYHPVDKKDIKYQQVKEYKYKDLVLSEKNGDLKLKTLQELKNISYQTMEGFDNLMKELYDETLSPESQDRYGVSIVLTYKTGIPSQNFFVNLYAGNQLLKMNHISVFTKGKSASECPNCKDQQIIIIKCNTLKIRDYLKKNKPDDIRYELTTKNVDARLVVNVQAIHLILAHKHDQKAKQKDNLPTYFQDDTLTVCFKTEIIDRATKKKKSLQTICYKPFEKNLQGKITYESVDYTITELTVTNKNGTYTYPIKIKVGQNTFNLTFPESEKFTFKENTEAPQVKPTNRVVLDPKDFIQVK